MAELYLIAGLGNPGDQYLGTRHNAGFDLVEYLAQHWKVEWKYEKKLESRLAQGRWQEQKLLLCQPQTFMNRSGDGLSRVLAFFRVPVAHLMVVVDDADLPLGKIRMRWDGSSGGHHGIESIETRLGSRQFGRLRIGIGRTEPQGGNISRHVLGRFGADEMEIFRQVLERAACQVECWLTDGITEAMSRFNGSIQTKRETK